MYGWAFLNTYLQRQLGCGLQFEPVLPARLMALAGLLAA